MSKAYALDKFPLFFEEVEFPSYKLKKPRIKALHIRRTRKKHSENTTKRIKS